MLTVKGDTRINDASRERKVNIVVDGSLVHVKCRRDFTNKKDIGVREKKNAFSGKKREIARRSDPPPQIRKNLCLYCHTPVQLEIRKKYSKRDPKLEGVRVATYDFGKTVRNICKSRNDQWSQEVLGGGGGGGGGSNLF